MERNMTMNKAVSDLILLSNEGYWRQLTFNQERILKYLSKLYLQQVEQDRLITTYFMEDSYAVARYVGRSKLTLSELMYRLRSNTVTGAVELLLVLNYIHHQELTALEIQCEKLTYSERYKVKLYKNELINFLFPGRNEQSLVPDKKLDNKNR